LQPHRYTTRRNSCIKLARNPRPSMLHKSPHNLAPTFVQTAHAGNIEKRCAKCTKKAPKMGAGLWEIK